MKNTSGLDQKLIAARARTAKGNAAFVARTMQAVQQTMAAETFERSLRTTNATKQRNFSMHSIRSRAARLSKATTIGLGIGTLAVVGGSAFAAYQLWSNASTQVTGNVVHLSNCRDGGDKNVVYVDPSNASNATTEAIVLRANCEIDNIMQYTYASLHVDTSAVRYPFTVTAVQKDAIEVVDPLGAKQKLPIASEKTTFIAGGVQTDASQFKAGDAVAYVGVGTGQPVKALIKLSEAATYYTPEMQNKIITWQPCPGNPADNCDMDSGPLSGVDIHPWGETGANPGVARGDWKTIEGKLVSKTADMFVIRGTSGAQFTVHTAEDLIDEFNTQYGKNYGASGSSSNLVINPGSTLTVTYIQAHGEDAHVIGANEIKDVTLAVIGSGKTGPVRVY